jgi:hypothetical protein
MRYLPQINFTMCLGKKKCIKKKKFNKNTEKRVIDLNDLMAYTELLSTVLGCELLSCYMKMIVPQKGGIIGIPRNG